MTPNTALPEPQYNEIKRALALFVQPGGRFEIRAFDVDGSPRSELFDADAIERAAEHAAELNRKGGNVYFTFNPVMDGVRGSAKDVDVARRRFVMIDVDPIRGDDGKKGMATDAEKVSAEAVMQSALDLLGDMRGRTLADSGNGYHAFFPVNLPNDEDAKALVKRLLYWLAERCDTDKAKIDKSVSNASRITRLYGTVNCKGENIEGRPWRRSSILDAAEWNADDARHNTEWIRATLEREPKAPALFTLRNGDKWLEAALNNETMAVLNAQNGERNNTLNRAAYSLGQLVGGGELNRAEVEENLTRAARGIGLADGEIVATIKSGIEAGLLKPRNRPQPNGKASSDAAQANDEKPAFYKFEPIDSRTFAIADYRPKWAVKGVLVCDQPAILGGPKKSLKTSCLTDLVLSLGSQTDFLGTFPVARKFRVAFISGESGRHTIQETAFRICHAKGIELAEQGVFWDFRLPQLAVDMELHSLSKGLQERGIEIVVIDPLYLCLLGGDTQGRQASNLFDMGPLLIRVAHACLSIGCTPVLAHHARKNIANAYEPLELEDLSFAGIQEFARQWILVNRRAAYEPGSGLHNLWLSTGGSIGHGCLWGVDIDEGRLDDQFGGRIWEVAVKPHQEVRQERVETVEGMKATREQEKRERKEKAEDAKLLAALDALDPEREGFGANKLRTKAGMSAARFDAAVMRLADEQIIEELAIDGAIGSGATRKIKAVRRLTLDHSNHSDHSD